ncbi:GNAT family protein [Spirulina sp. 06S082]|uniref:GNAT family N-acetyltransferase n=1 Tax=Spirulina sp. 06S082 TaxID=3110248 RepID=UPI002B20A98B|nr:GNAT family protein [Spirulina sp. 06S082]MEA5471588.1 GNAT family protein [Spirulina sp. 06S082]
MRIELRETRVKDLDFVLTVEGDRENRPYIYQWSREQHQAAFTNVDIFHGIIEAIANKKLLGYFILEGLQSPDRCLSLRRIAIAQKGQGYGREALQLLKKLAFENYNAHRFCLDVKEFNQRAKHLYETEGFVLEGKLRENFQGENGFESCYILSILEQEYRSTPKLIY